MLGDGYFFIKERPKGHNRLRLFPAPLFMGVGCVVIGYFSSYEGDVGSSPAAGQQCLV